MKEELLAQIRQCPNLPSLPAIAMEGTHAEVTGYLADEWKLPPLLATPMRHHHDPQSVEDAQLRKLADVGYVAGLCADVFVDANATAALGEVRTYCMDR